MNNPIWFGVAAMAICMIFLLRTFRSKSISLACWNALLFCFYAYLGYYFLPIPIPEFVQWIFRKAMIIAAAFVIIIQGGVDFVKWLRTVRIFQFRFPIRLPEYLWEVIRAVERLTALKTGALIVIEREDSLEEYSKHAVNFDSEVNKDVMVSIFHTSSPLHDGALLIRKGRMRGARMILPLATKSEVPLGYGTRHRSAIGITERSDAIALIVSEERGQMSISYGGKILKADSAEIMAEFLSDVLKGKDPAEKFKK